MFRRDRGDKTSQLTNITQLSAWMFHLFAVLDCLMKHHENVCSLALAGLHLSFRAVGWWEMVSSAVKGPTKLSCLVGVK